jgi:esterase/lipase superfamily enzyme
MQLMPASQHRLTYPSTLIAPCRALRLLRLLLGLWIAALLAGCQAPVRLMPTPVPFVDGYVDPFATAGVALEGTEVPVFYATNRAALVEKPEPVHLIVPSETLRLGVAHVRVGDETLDWPTLHRLSLTADPGERPILELMRLEQLATLNVDERVEDSAAAIAFFEHVNAALASSPNSELLVYVHGANNTVRRASAQASQFRHFTGRRKVVVVFMWPSAGSLLRYLTDVGNAAATVDTFARFIETLAGHSQASKIDVLAYSAGAQVTSPALAKLGTPGPGESREQLRERLRLGQIYFAAPDIGTRRFVDDLKVYVDLVDRVSLSINLNDSVLRLAAMVARGSRAGRPDVGELNAEQTTFLIDASNELHFDVINVRPEDIPNLPPRSHAFWYEDPWVSGDLLVQFLLNLPPDRRGLDPQATPSGKRYWGFPADFDQRVRRIVRTRVAPDAEPAPR